MFKKKIRFKNSRNLNLSAIFEGENRDAPVIVMCHGYNSSKDRPSTAGLAARLVNKGLSVFRFDFTGNGESEGKLDDLTPSVGINDLKSAIKNLGKRQFGLYGKSFGGCVALLYASQNSVLVLGLVAPVSDYLEVETIYQSVDKFTPKKKTNFLEEIKDINIYKIAKNIKAPTLIVHGDKDPIVPLSQSKKLLKSLAGEKRLEILPGAGHVMSDEDIEKASTLIADFLAKTLKVTRYHP